MLTGGAEHIKLIDDNGQLLPGDIERSFWKTFPINSFFSVKPLVPAW